MPPNAQNTESSRAEWDGYRGEARNLLESNGVRAGTRVKLVMDDGSELTGLVVPRYEHAVEDHVVLKLKSGYNIGVLAGRIQSLAVIEAASQAKFGLAREGEEKSLAVEQKSKEKTLLLLSTGGTIASRVDYRTGAVHPALSADDLYAAVPELGNIASIIPEVVFSTYSENLTPLDWQKLSEAIVSRSESLGAKLDGVVVMLGTDTLAYVSAALSFSLQGFAHPVVCVGAQRSSDGPSSDAALNLKAAARFAVHSTSNGVFVSMHNSENDDYIAIHSGVRVRKNHTSRRDAFESIDTKLIARVKESEILMENSRTESKDPAIKLKTRFEPKVGLVKFHPGFDPSILDYYFKIRGMKGLVIEGTGLGHVSSATVEKLSEIVKSGAFICITSQCIWGHVDLSVYETGRDLIEAGVVPLENMIAETAFAKLSWTLGNHESGIKEIMTQNLVGEFTERIALNASQ